MIQQEEVSVSTLIRIPEGPRRYARRLSIAAWLNENPWVDTIESGHVEFDFKGSNLKRNYRIFDKEDKVEPY